MRLLKGQSAYLVISQIARGLVKKYGSIGEKNYESVIKAFSKIRVFGRVNGFLGMKFPVALTPSDKPSWDSEKLRWFLRELDKLDVDSKVNLIRLMFYDVLNLLEKKAVSYRKAKSLVSNRLKEDEKWLENFKWLLLAPFDRCNLNCHGCYAKSNVTGAEPDFQKIDYIISQAKRLNVLSILIVGKGEPFYDETSKEVLFNIAKKHRDILFKVFTNGTLIEEEDVRKIKKLGNLLPFVSVDGLKETNDWRRGEEVYKRVVETFRLMRKHSLLFCFTTTVFRGNYAHVTSREFVSEMTEMGNRLGLYCQFIPVGGDKDAEMALKAENIAEYYLLLEKINKESRIPLIDADFYERFTGCASRKGIFIYVDGITGRVYPCIKTPFSPQECNIFHNPHKNRLLEVLQTDFFVKHRSSYSRPYPCHFMSGET